MLNIISDFVKTILPAKRKTTPKMINNITTRGIKGMYYLYVKTHNVTGLKYLGQTKRNPETYRGSGKRWNNHLNVHGNDVTTEILFETDDKAALAEKGLYYSKLWNIVEDYNWANIVVENGSGGDTSKSPNYIKSLATQDLSFKQAAEYREKVSGSVRQAWEDKFNSKEFDNDAYKQMCSNRSTIMWETRGISDEDRLLRSNIMKQYIIDHPEYLDQISATAKRGWQEKSKLYEVTFPDGHIEQVRCFRGWCEDNELPYSKLYNTMRYNRASKEGWMVRIID